MKAALRRLRGRAQRYAVIYWSAMAGAAVVTAFRFWEAGRGHHLSLYGWVILMSLPMLLLSMTYRSAVEALETLEFRTRMAAHDRLFGLYEEQNAARKRELEEIIATLRAEPHPEEMLGD